MEKYVVWGRVFSSSNLKLYLSEPVKLGEKLDMEIRIDGEKLDYIVAMRSYESQEIDAILRKNLTEDDLKKEITVTLGGYTTRIYPIEVLEKYAPDFEEELGALYSKDRTIFKIWAPTASRLDVLLYKDPDSEEPDEILEAEYVGKGIWKAEKEGNLDGWFYLYEIEIYGERRRVVDIYSKSVSLNGKKSAIVDLSSTNPQGWENDLRPRIDSRTQAIIYEIHVEDFTGLGSSGVDERFRGKYLGLVQEGTKGPHGTRTALDHLKELGITHVQILPLMIFKSCREDDDECYNWGYDPYLYMVPSGKYSTDPRDPKVRIKELKEMIMKLHENGIRVILDVVFPHTYKVGEGSPFDQTVPYYFYRMTPDGKYLDETSCGNTTATERKMVKKFFLDVLRYWTEEYHVDGFRFDQMGVIDVDLLDRAAKMLHEIDRGILLYGEPWGGLGATIRFYKGVQRGKAIGVFNDDYRDSIRGSVFEPDKKGFVMGERGYERRVAVGLLGSPTYLGGFTLHPEETINYAECHDNHTLWDKNFLAAKLDEREWSEEELKRAQKLAGGLIILGLGIPFLHEGQDFCRSKNFNPNSYNAGLDVNGIDWGRKARFRDVFEYYKGLIRLRKEHPAFWLNNFEEARDKVKILRAIDHLVVVFYGDHTNEDPWKDIIAIYNGSLEKKKYNLPEGVWNVVVDSKKAGVETIRVVSDRVVLEPLSMIVAWR